MRRRKKYQPPHLSDGRFWVWVRLFVPLRGGHYHREWLPARVEGDTVRLFGSGSAIPLSAPVLANALWSGPLDPPPLEPLAGNALTLQRAWNCQRRNPEYVESGCGQ